ncbi:hypothetical protein K461DRAFT_267065 [Myriangium duriaei CBS 260.36]|uniref:Uncharacterized protein n=1 Tax=Myriangium duriaei CBS 260.36 TaxID=1168546 RepID=A0A9P4J1Y6_9PEZI|nr:hypothetical protein K461DRAFT_267065 [Myriangium duriaei CBS 260.36]
MSSRIVRLLSTPLILSLSLPLTTFAIFTTLLALTTLLIRVSIVYVELFLAILQSALVPSVPVPKTTTTTTSSAPPSPAAVQGVSIRPRHRPRRTSSSSSSSGLVISTPAAGGLGNASRTQSLSSLINGTAGQATPRDYESVGGWRLTSSNAADEALWTGINARLELPALTLPSPSGRWGGNRRGSAWGGKAAGSPPETRRRWRREGRESPEGYFGVSNGGSCSSAAESPALVMTTGRMSGSGSRGQSRRSSVSFGRVRE